MEQKRAVFTSGLGVLAATLGSAVGLGNIWKFPYLTGSQGGAAFLLIYLVSTLLVALPVMISEIMIGRAARANPVTAFKHLAPKKPVWRLIGWGGALGAFLIMSFYSAVAGWVFSYVFKSFGTKLTTGNADINAQVFASLVSSPMEALIWQWVVLIFVGCIIVMGVTKGIESTTKKLMPMLFVLLVVICIRALTLPGAEQGLEFLFKPDFSKITGSVILTAMGLAFFKLSLGMGSMMTYGSYFRDDQNIPATAFKVMIADLTVSMLAGMTIFPAVFAFGFKPDAGPSLLFMTIPAVFSSMPFGNVFMILFFVLTAMAATGAMISIVEVPVVFLSETRQWSRRKSTIVVTLALMLTGAPAALSSSSFMNVKIFGMTFFDLYDFLSSNIIMPLSGILICVFVAWSLGHEKIKMFLGQGMNRDSRVICAVHFAAKWITPVLVGVILLKGLKAF